MQAVCNSGLFIVNANFKISFTSKNWLLKFGFAYRLAQILEPKSLAHEILKFVWPLFGWQIKLVLIFNHMQCFSTEACTSNVRGDWGI